MLQPRAVLRFAVVLLVVYGALSFPAKLVPAVGRAYAAAFRFGGDAFFSHFWFRSEGRVRFLDLRSDSLADDVNAAMPGSLGPDFPMPAATTDKDTLLLLMNRKTPGEVGLLRTGSYIIGYVPTAVLVSLILATPLPWSRRAWALVWGLVLIHLFIAVRLSILMTNHGFAAPGKKYALFHPGPFWANTLSRCDEVLADNPTFAYVAPVVLWLVILVGLAAWHARRERAVARSAVAR